MLIERYHQINIFQIGVGGTGSWLVYPLCKFLSNLVQRFSQQLGLIINYIVIDDDIVEERNILRQNFEPYDIGRSKVNVTIRKYCNVFPIAGIRFRAKTKRGFDKVFYGDLTEGISPVNSITFIFGCVDNNESRRRLFSYMKKKELRYPVVYFDSGNDLYHGQIVTSIFEIGGNENHRSFVNESRFKQPKFLKMFPLKMQDGETEESCAFFGDQSQAINLQASNLLFSNFQQAIIHSQLPPPVINFNSAGFSTFQL